MSDALSLTYFPTVSGVDALSEADLALEYRGAGSAPWDTRQGRWPWPPRASSGTLSVVSSSQKRLSSSVLPGSSRCRRTGLPAFVSRVLPACGPGPRGLLMAGALSSRRAEGSGGQQLAPGARTLPPAAWIRLRLHPTQGKPSVLSHPTHCWQKGIWGFPLG